MVKTTNTFTSRRQILTSKVTLTQFLVYENKNIKKLNCTKRQVMYRFIITFLIKLPTFI